MHVDLQIKIIYWSSPAAAPVCVFHAVRLKLRPSALCHYCTRVPKKERPVGSWSKLTLHPRTLNLFTKTEHKIDCRALTIPTVTQRMTTYDVITARHRVSTMVVFRLYNDAYFFLQIACIHASYDFQRTIGILNVNTTIILSPLDLAERCTNNHIPVLITTVTPPSLLDHRSKHFILGGRGEKQKKNNSSTAQ